tara:strand:+ start:54 stop:917 length:864 start_codon:yes stop_codon:yes gene_type:complete
MSCSPKISNKNYTCYTLKELKNIANNYNIYNKSNNKITKININLKKKELWEKLIEVNYNKCSNNEYCWLQRNYMKINKDYKKYIENFRPEKPYEWEKDPDKWLNTYNILNVMNQYEDKYNNFRFIGVFPIDFMTKINDKCVSTEMCSLNLEELKKNKITKLGFIFNLDKHYQSGSHWVSLFINLNKNNNNFGSYFYDSNGTSPPIEIKKFIKNFKIKLKNSHPNLIDGFKFNYNKKRHQFTNSECGMFSLYFLNQCLKNISFDKFVNDTNLNDKYVFKLRNKYFLKT